MSARLRSVLHQCADLIADALEEELSARTSPDAKSKAATKTPTRRASIPKPTALPANMTPETVHRAIKNCRELGLRVPPELLELAKRK